MTSFSLMEKFRRQLTVVESGPGPLPATPAPQSPQLVTKAGARHRSLQSCASGPEGTSTGFWSFDSVQEKQIENKRLSQAPAWGVIL